MTVTEAAATLNSALQELNSRIAENPNAQVATKPLGANIGYVCNVAVPTVCILLGGDPNIPLT